MKLKFKDILESWITLVFLGFVLAPMLVAYLNVDVGNLLYALGAMILLIGLVFMNPGFSGSTLTFIFLYTAWILFFTILFPRFFGIEIGVSLRQFTYYLKPPFFFLVGYLLLSKEKLDRQFVRIAWIAIIGAIFFKLNEETLLGIAVSRDPQGQGVAHFLSFGGEYIRNCSVFLSPLDTGFVCFFLCAYFFFTQRKRLSALLCTVLILTITRSAMVALLVAVPLHLFLKSNLLNKILYVLLFAVMAALVIVLFFPQIDFVLFKDGSAAMHFSNLKEVVQDLMKFPMGHGIGYSGWGSIGQKNHLYSEGSFQTMIMENGLPFALFFLALGRYLFKVDSAYSFPIFLGFMAASLMIPIGFSTLFNLVFFGYVGVVCKTHEKGSSYHHNQLE